MIAYGVHPSGRREVIGIDVGQAETEAFWREFLRSLRARGLVVCGCASLTPTTGSGRRSGRSLAAGATLHRALPARHARPRRYDQQPMIAAAIRGIFQATSLAEARQRLVESSSGCSQPHLRCGWLQKAAEADLLAFYELPRQHWSKLSSTNPLERVNREIGRRTDVVGIFPTMPRCCAWPAPCSSSRTMSGWWPAATYRRSRLRS